MTDRLRAIEGLALVAALTAVFDSVHPLGDHWINAAKAVSTFHRVSSTSRRGVLAAAGGRA
ncbi:hypothetical protein [Streptomyces sp. NPDC089799]|uniref:hypothetical protein n=1 Tax=Streptomyces sp. NPDC089799 TaxID=3155066 RepID=UPI003440B716